MATESPTTIEYPTLVHFRHFSSLLTNEYPVSRIQHRVSIAQKHLIMQNKPNFPNTQINVTSVNTMNYELRTMNYFMQNKPNSNPIQTQFKANQTQTKPIQSQSNPISNQSLPKIPSLFIM